MNAEHLNLKLDRTRILPYDALHQNFLRKFIMITSILLIQIIGVSLLLAIDFADNNT